jgi:hypothetical protein
MAGKKTEKIQGRPQPDVSVVACRSSLPQQWECLVPMGYDVVGLHCSNNPSLQDSLHMTVKGTVPPFACSRLQQGTQRESKKTNKCLSFVEKDRPFVEFSSG